MRRRWANTPLTRTTFVVAITLATLAPNAIALPPEVLSTTDLGVHLPAAPEFFDGFGASAAVIGDVDGNGVVDVAVGAPGDDDGGTDRGAVYVFLLDSVGGSVSTKKISATSGGFGGALDDYDAFGTAVAGIGDIDANGVPDLAVGAIRDDDALLDAGAVWVLTLDQSGAVTTTHKLSALTPGMTGALAKWDSFGSAIVSIAGLLQAGSHQLAIGARGDDGSGFDRGAVWLLALDAELHVVSKQKIDDATQGLVGQLPERGWFGAALARSGSRLLVGAPGDEGSFAAPGTVWLLDLAGDGSVAAARHIAVDPPADRFGAAVGFVGDFDFDGVEDLTVGRPTRPVVGGSSAGLFEVLLMNDDATIREARRYPTELYGFGGRLGASLAVLPDIDGNLIPEILAGAPDEYIGGAAWLYFLNGISADSATCGDPTGDGAVQASDALLVLRAAVRLAFCELLYCDADRSGRISASDALLVLQKAVTSEVTLSCPTTTTTTVTSTTIIIIDECFSDDDCVSYGDPERPCCDGYECAACAADAAPSTASHAGLRFEAQQTATPPVGK